jgi:hypothetical protein
MTILLHSIDDYKIGALFYGKGLAMSSKKTHKQWSPIGDRKTVAGAVAMVAELGNDKLRRLSDEIRAGWRKKPWALSSPPSPPPSSSCGDVGDHARGDDHAEAVGNGPRLCDHRVLLGPIGRHDHRPVLREEEDWHDTT